MSKCFNCKLETAEIKRVARFVKKWRGDYLEIKIFECLNCHDIWCTIAESDWKPKEGQEKL